MHGNAPEHAPGRRLDIRRTAHALQVRQHDQIGRLLRAHAVEDVVDAHALVLRLLAQVPGQLVAVPLHHHAAGGVVGVGHVAAPVHVGHAGVVLAGVACILRDGGVQRLDALGGAGAVHRVAGLVHAAGQGVDDLVVRSDDHAHLLRKAQALCNVRQQRPQIASRLIDLGHLIDAQPRRIQQLPGPAALLHIVEQRAAGQRHVRRGHAAQAVADVARDQQELPHRPLGHPKGVEHLRQRIGRIRHDARGLHELLRAHLLHQCIELLRRGIRKVHDDVGQRPALIVHRHKGLAEGGHRDRRDFILVRQRVHAFADDLHHRCGQHLRLQVHLSGRVGILHVAQRQLFAVVPKGHAFCTGSADIDTQTDHNLPPARLNAFLLYTGAVRRNGRCIYREPDTKL